MEETTVMELPSEIIEHSSLKCCHAWRSIGTHIWFEFGVPKINLMRNCTRSVQGDMTMHVSSYYWELFIGGSAPLTSETVDDSNFAALVKPWFQDQMFPSFEAVEADVLKLRFSDAAVLVVHPTDEEDPEEEITTGLTGVTALDVAGFYRKRPRNRAKPAGHH